MRLSAEAGFRLFAFGLIVPALAGCELIGGGDRPQGRAAAPAGAQLARGSGPEADYPMVLGEPFTVEGKLYTPADTLNYDTVGYAGIDQGEGVTVAHRTLPLPSYVEVTSLETGKTILARVDRRGPMAGASLVALSPAAASQLGEDEGAPVRVRRVNPPETDRVELRSGRPAVARIDTPKSLVEVLRRKLPASGSASLRAPLAPRPAAIASSTATVAVPVRSDQPVVAAAAPKPTAIAAAESASTAPPQAVAAYPLQPLAGVAAKPKPVVVARAEPAPIAFSLAQPQRAAPAPTAKPAAKPTAVPAAVPAPSAIDGFVVQAGTFANHTNAQRAAEALGGYVSPSGKLFRVRTGPFASRGQAEAALAKVRAAGYSDARVYTAG